MNRFLKILTCGIFLITITPVWAIMGGGPLEVMKEEMQYNKGEISLESNFIFESDISPDASSNKQSEKGEWYFAKGTGNINDFMDFYVRLGASHLEQEDRSQSIKEDLEWAFAFGGGVMAELYEYAPWNLKVILDAQYYATFPDIKSLKIGSASYTSGTIHEKSYKEHNIQTTLFSRTKLGPIFPYAGVVFSYRDITNKFEVNNVRYNLSGKNKNKVGLSAGFDFPFNLEEIAQSTGVLSVEGRFFDEVGLSVALTNRF